eukprot:2496943-Pyramimonas_sp.AAC.1
MASTLVSPKTEFAKFRMDSQTLGGSSCRSRGSNVSLPMPSGTSPMRCSTPGVQPFNNFQ